MISAHYMCYRVSESQWILDNLVTELTPGHCMIPMQKVLTMSPSNQWKDILTMTPDGTRKCKSQKAGADRRRHIVKSYLAMLSIYMAHA
jgi:hypothetical protein